MSFMQFLVTKFIKRRQVAQLLIVIQGKISHIFYFKIGNLKDLLTLKTSVKLGFEV